MTWSNSPYSLNLADAIEEGGTTRLVYSDSTDLPVLSNSYHLMFVILHAYREGFVPTWMDPAQTMTFMQFTDIWRFWNFDRAAAAAMLQLAHKKELQTPVGQVLKAIDRTFASDLYAQAGFC
jgi:hypothetical protein